jgi:hypothetical protein
MPKPTGPTCPLLVEGQCVGYHLRPLVCRAWGAVATMQCPHGCQPDQGWISELDVYDAQRELLGTEKTTSPWAGGPCLSCGRPVEKRERAEGSLHCRDCALEHIRRLIPWYAELASRRMSSTEHREPSPGSG